MKASFIKLRNRALNKFKTIKTKKIGARAVKKVARPNKIKKTLRVRKVNISTKPADQKTSKPGSPVGKTSPVAKVSKDVMHSIIGHRRLFLRNRRLMHAAPHRPMVAAF